VPSKRELAQQISIFGANIRRERMARQLTQEHLAELVDLNIRTLQKIEAGETNILITTAVRLQRAIDCPWDRLFAGVS
jgi:transcriptional regulator with XRE-family HTH domain